MKAALGLHISCIECSFLFLLCLCASGSVSQVLEMPTLALFALAQHCDDLPNQVHGSPTTADPAPGRPGSASAKGTAFR